VISGRLHFLYTVNVRGLWLRLGLVYEYSVLSLWFVFIRCRRIDQCATWLAASSSNTPVSGAFASLHDVIVITCAAMLGVYFMWHETEINARIWKFTMPRLFAHRAAHFDWCLTYSLQAYVSLRCYTSVYLQHGGAYCCIQNFVTVTDVHTRTRGFWPV